MVELDKYINNVEEDKLVKTPIHSTQKYLSDIHTITIWIKAILFQIVIDVSTVDALNKNNFNMQ